MAKTSDGVVTNAIGDPVTVRIDGKEYVAGSAEISFGSPSYAVQPAVQMGDQVMVAIRVARLRMDLVRLDLQIQNLEDWILKQIEKYAGDEWTCRDKTEENFLLFRDWAEDRSIVIPDVPEMQKSLAEHIVIRVKEIRWRREAIEKVQRAIEVGEKLGADETGIRMEGH